METLQRKSAEGGAQLFVAMALVLFLPAWTILWWQAWVFLGVFFVSVAAITVYFLKRDPKLIERRLKAGPGAETDPAQKIIQGITSIAFLAVLLVPGFDHRLGWSVVPWPLTLVGDVIVAAGFYLIFLVFRENSYTSGVIETADNQTVIDTGPYAVVRHPMYAGAVLMFLGVPLALGSYWSLVPVAVMFGGIVVRLLAEERYLIAHLPGYGRYRTKTRFRLLPGIW
jgi:protein-S-isoprenylcysteine O-methyltransferase Ste14